MSIVSDEQLMAFADGALPEAEARALEIMLADDLVLQARLEPFLVTGAPLAAVFEGPLHAPVPERLIAAIASAPVRKPQTFMSAGHARESLADRVWANLFGSEFRLATAAFAAVLVVAGATGWTLLHPQNTLDVAHLKPGMIADGALKTALETMVSSDQALPGTVTPVMTLPRRDGQGVCRQYRMDGGASGWFGGLACRDADGQWRVAAHVKAPAPAQNTGYQSAGGNELQGVEAASDALTKGDALDTDTERTLIARGWSTPAR